MLEMIKYLYISPLAKPGINPSQMPEESERTFKGCALRCQLLKLPITETFLALGAQTAKCTPAWPSTTIGWAPNFS